MALAALSVASVKACPAENVLYVLTSMEAPRAELRRGFDIRLQPMANIYIILVWYIHGRYGFQGMYKSRIMTAGCDSSK